MKRSDIFPSNYVKCEDLKGKQVTLRIKDVTVEKMGDDEKPVCWFYQREKGLVLNQTNWDIIEGIHGPESDDWLGKSITIYPTKVMFAGKRVDAIRVREMAPTFTPTPAPPAPNGQGKSQQTAPAMTQKEADAGQDDGVEDDDTPF